MQSTYCTCVQLTYCTWCSRHIALVCSWRIVHGAHATSTEERNVQDRLQFIDIALVTLYSNPHPHLLERLYGVLASCTKLGEESLQVIKITDIRSVVAMIPHHPVIHGVAQDRYFLAEPRRQHAPKRQIQFMDHNYSLTFLCRPWDWNTSYSNAQACISATRRWFWIFSRWGRGKCARSSKGIHGRGRWIDLNTSTSHTVTASRCVGRWCTRAPEWGNQISLFQMLLYTHPFRSMNPLMF